MNNNPRDPGSLYLPERYKQQIEAKKKRRLVKKIAAFCGVIAACILLYLVLSGGVLNTPAPSTLTLPGPLGLSLDNVSLLPSGEGGTPSSQNITARENPGISIGPGVPVMPSGDMLSLDTATAFLRQDYPASDYGIISVNVTDRYRNRILYEFTLRPPGSGSGNRRIPRAG